jgi:K+-dependent Na+/Ca+ exchanger-like protein
VWIQEAIVKQGCSVGPLIRKRAPREKPPSFHDTEVIAREKQRVIFAAFEAYDGPMRSPWFGLLYLAATLYLFVGIAVVCDKYFEPVLDAISEDLGLSPDVAGATFMAAGSSAPELFTSAADTFTTENNIGVGTIVGSAMFNVLIIVAAAALYAGRDLRIDWRPIARDLLFYSAAVLSVAIAFWDGYANTREAAAMVCLYVIYVGYMCYNEAVITALCPRRGDPSKPDSGNSASMSIHDDPTSLDVASTETQELHKGDTGDVCEGEGGAATGLLKASRENADGVSVYSTRPAIVAAGADDSREDDELRMLDDALGRCLFALCVPFHAVFSFTIPEVRDDGSQARVCATFAACIVWLGILCIAMANFATAIGCLWNIDPLIMGVLVLAVGTSVPDAIASMIVAKKGNGDMAVANAIGSNVFDILLGLGAPWLVFGATQWCGEGGNTPVARRAEDLAALQGATSWTTAEPQPCVTNLVGDSPLFGELAILYCTVIIFVAALVINHWTMNARLAQMLMFVYVTYVVYTAALARARLLD